METKGGIMTRDKFLKSPVGQASVPVTTKENKELAEQASLPGLNEEQVSIYRRKLPHWRQAGAVYFVTWRLHPSQPELTPDERTLVVAALEHFQKERYILFAHVVMDNHAHVLVKPIHENVLQAILHSWKSFTALQIQRQFARQGAIWQDEYFDRIERDEAEFLEKAQYILDNPRKRWPELEEYPWAGYFDDASE
jgi:REP element-mobilizing transposase RayT